MAVLLALLFSTPLQDVDYRALLRDVNPTVRRNAISIIAERGYKAAIDDLVRLLGRESDAEVKADAAAALARLTNEKGLGADAAKWQAWWEQTGRHQQAATSAISEERLRDLQREIEKDVEKTITEVRILAIIVAIIAFAFVLVMIYFVGHVSSKLKEWKELVRQAAVYIEESNQITKRTDRILEELEAKKSDILGFVTRIKEEKEAEIERYNDLLQQNTEHRMREEVMSLRQKAEKELQETLGQLRQGIETDLRRMAAEHKEKLGKDLGEQSGRFMREVEAHTLFLQANFVHSRGRLEEALKIYKRLLQVKPDHQVAWERMGSAYRELMRNEEALEAFEKAVQLNPDDPSAYYNMAATYARLRKREKMLETLSLAIKNDGEFKDEALNDPSFRDFWNDPAFKDLAEA